MAEQRHALYLDHPGAPATAHTVPGYPGYYWPDRPTPVGGDGELSLDAAKAAAKDPGVPLRIEKITEAEAKRANDEIGAHRSAARMALADNAANAKGSERIIADEERAMLAEQVAAAAGSDDGSGD